MKKYMIAAVAAMLMAGISQAQVAKQPSKPNGKEIAATKKTAPQHKTVAATQSVSPATATKAKPSATTIKRKHHKKAKATKKEATK